jgi:hypothetical protein
MKTKIQLCNIISIIEFKIETDLFISIKTFNFNSEKV